MSSHRGSSYGGKSLWAINHLDETSNWTDSERTLALATAKQGALDLKQELARKDAIINHLEGMNLAPQRSTPIPDPPIFDGTSDLKLNHWIMKMSAKLRINYDHYESNEERVLYTASRLGGSALDHIIPRLTDEAKKPFDTPEEIFKILEAAFESPVKDNEAYLQYYELQQADRSFAAFWEQFQRYAAPLNIPEATMVEDLHCRVSTQLQQAIEQSGSTFTTPFSLAVFCFLEEFKIKEARVLQERAAQYQTPYLGHDIAEFPQRSKEEAGPESLYGDTVRSESEYGAEESPGTDTTVVEHPASLEYLPRRAYRDELDERAKEDNQGRSKSEEPVMMFDGMEGLGLRIKYDDDSCSDSEA